MLRKAQPLKVLLIDDDYDSQTLTKRVIKKQLQDAVVIEKENGMKALGYISSTGKPDIIILDVDMMQMDGYEFLLQYKRMWHSNGFTKLFVLTSSIIQWELDKLLSLGILSGYMQKPFTNEDFSFILENC